MSGQPIGHKPAYTTSLLGTAGTGILLRNGVEICTFSDSSNHLRGKIKGLFEIAVWRWCENNLAKFDLRAACILFETCQFRIDLVVKASKFVAVNPLQMI